MADVSVETQGVRAFGATNAGVAGEIAAAGNLDAAASVAAMTPVFGLIGADYLAMFAAAQVLQTQDIHDLAGRYRTLSEAAFSSAAQYDETDLGSAFALGQTGKGL